MTLPERTVKNPVNFQDPPGRGHLALESSGGHPNPKFNLRGGMQ
jgi:hypothetical protein